MNVADYIKYLSSVETYSFSLEEAVEATNKGDTSTKSELSRLIEKKEVANLRKGFYLILTPRYSSFEKLPVQLYCEKLFKYLNRNYYLGLYTAAKMHGAGHQQPQRDYLIIETPKLNNIKKKAYDLRFITTGHWPLENIEIKKADAGIYHISSPILTIVDLIQHQTKLGGLNRMLATIEELAEEIKENDIAKLLSWYPNRSTIQRLGFLLEETKENASHSNQIFEYLKSLIYYPVLLSPKSTQKPGAVDNRWKVDVNIKLESDL